MESHQSPSEISGNSGTGSGVGGDVSSNINVAEIANSFENSKKNFENESDHYEIDNGTVKFIGCTASNLHGIDNILNDHINNVNSDEQNDYMTIKAPNSNHKLGSEQLTKTELLNMLCRLEGELQARDVVIATLRNERVKQLIHNLRNQPKILLNDPHAALFRDKMASAGHLVSRQSSVTAIQGEMELRAIIEQQMESLYKMVTKQRSTQTKMVIILKESLDNNQKMRQELEDEKRKHEHDTAQGDDITYGLEIERTKLKQELESERTQRKKLEKDLKKIQEQFDFERGRQKQIVLLLLAERKKIIMKYIEERKRSEDLAQILSEEKQQKDSMADGLEEETKKSLRMEAELERQTSQFEQERKLFALNFAKEEKRIRDLEIELAQLKSVHIPVVGQVISTKMRSIPIPTGEIRNPSSVIDVAKIVQPTATVSSVPVSGPTTGIARSVNSTVIGGFNSPATKTLPRKQVAAIVQSQTQQQTLQQQSLQQQQQQHQQPEHQQLPQQHQQQQIQNLNHNQSSILTNTSCVLATTTTTSSVLTSAEQQISQNKQSTAFGKIEILNTTNSSILPGSTTNNSSGGGGGGGNIGSTPSTSSFIGNSFNAINVKSLPINALNSNAVITSSSNNNTSINNTGLMMGVNQQQQQQPQLQSNIPTTGITSIPILPGTGNNSTTAGSGGTTGGPLVGSVPRGVPPPIPPNKPVVPPKREPSISRLGSSISTSNMK